MARFVAEFSCDNAAFDEGMATEIGRILRDVAQRVERGDFHEGDGGAIHDSNGNRVGNWRIDEHG